MYLKHKHMVEYFRETRFRRKAIIISSRCFLIIGYAAAFGLSIAANFQVLAKFSFPSASRKNFFVFQNEKVSMVKTVGLLIMFGCGLVYSWCHGILSFLLPPQMTPRPLAQCRISSAFFSLVFFCGSNKIFEIFMSGSLFYIFSICARFSIGWSEKYLRKFTCESSLRPEILNFKSLPFQEALYYISAVSECGLTLSLNFFLLTIAYDLYGSKLQFPKLHLRTIEQMVQTTFLDSYRLEYMSNSNLHNTKPESSAVSHTTSPVSVRTTATMTAPEPEPEPEPVQELTLEEPNVVTMHTFHPSPELSRIVRHESMASGSPPAQRQQRPTAFSYIPDMPNPFNEIGQLKKTYD